MTDLLYSEEEEALRAAVRDLLTDHCTAADVAARAESAAPHDLGLWKSLAQSMGLAGLLIPEALGPLILGYTFLFVAIVDMSAVVGAVAGGGLGSFAIQYGYQRYDYAITWLTVAVIVVIVQLAQALGNLLARRVLRR